MLVNTEAQDYCIICLKQDIELKLGRTIASPVDFDYLQRAVHISVGESPSVSTLKRLWRYTHSSVRTRTSTLSLLARFLGYRGWDKYVEHLMRKSKVESGFLDESTIFAHDLRKGDRLHLSWKPDRSVELSFLGDDSFEVTKSVNASIQIGDILCVKVFSLGLPLVCTRVYRSDRELGAYVAGKDFGLTGLQFSPVSGD